MAPAEAGRGRMTGQRFREDSTVTVQQRMDQLEAAVAEAVEEYKRLGVAAIEAAAKEEEAYARAFLGVEGAEHFRKQTAILRTVRERFDRRIADHLVKVQEKVLWKLHDEIDMARSRNANVRKEAELAMAGGRP